MLAKQPESLHVAHSKPHITSFIIIIIIIVHTFIHKVVTSEADSHFTPKSI